jgi:hypothetical protein
MINKRIKTSIVILSISILFAYKNSDYGVGEVNPNLPLILVVSGLVTAVSADVVNCMYPYYNGEYENIGMFIPCSWEEEDFYYKDGRYILHKTNSDDNWIEKRMRKRYWRIND